MAAAPVRRLEMPFGEINDLADAYRKLRVLIGVLALALCPVIILAEYLFPDPDFSDPFTSISGYYYSRGGGWFIGSLFAMAVFFLTYEYKRRDDSEPGDGRRTDNLLSSAASIFAVTVALAPTSTNFEQSVGGERIVHWVHGIAAALLFCTMAVFSLLRFTRTTGENKLDLSLKDELLRAFRTDWDRIARELGPDYAPTPKKLLRNGLYRVLGWTIVLSIVAALAARLSETFEPLFFPAEVVATVAFALSWLIKGEAFPFFCDEPIIEARDQATRSTADRAAERA